MAAHAQVRAAFPGCSLVPLSRPGRPGRPTRPRLTNTSDGWWDVSEHLGGYCRRARLCTHRERASSGRPAPCTLATGTWESMRDTSHGWSFALCCYDVMGSRRAGREAHQTEAEVLRCPQFTAAFPTCHYPSAVARDLTRSGANAASLPSPHLPTAGSHGRSSVHPLATLVAQEG